MKVFISWSGDQSRAIAEALRDWLPKVIQSVEPWMSSKDIRKGGRWQSEIGDHLESSDFGIACLTPSNLEAPWLLFESGALAKKVKSSHLCTYLTGVSLVNIAEPLRQFQATNATEIETFKLVQAINEALGDQALSDTTLAEAFEVWWPKLDKKLAAVKPDIPKQEAKVSLEQVAKGIDELLQLARSASSQALFGYFPSAPVNLGLGKTRPVPGLFWGEDELPLAAPDAGILNPQPAEKLVVSPKLRQKLAAVARHRAKRSKEDGGK